MEKKKLLLVAVAVGVVMLIIIGIPLILISPGRGNSMQFQTGRTAAPVEIVPRPLAIIEIPEVVQAPEQPAIPVPVVPAGAPQVTTITVPTPRTVAVPSVPVVPAAKPTAKPPAPKPAAKPAEKPAPEASKPAVVQPTAKPTTPKPAATDKTYSNYWVQTGAFSTIARAEGVKSTLSSKGITSIIENREVDGKTVFRVRVGPYTSQNEANYWLSLIKSINGFEDSQVRQTQSLR